MGQGEGIPIIIHIDTREVCRIQANCVRGLCFSVPLFGGLLQRAGQKEDEGVLQAEGTAYAKADSCWGRRRLWESGERWTDSGAGPGWGGGGLADKKDAASPGLGAGLAAWEA